MVLDCFDCMRLVEQHPRVTCSRLPSSYEAHGCARPPHVKFAPFFSPLSENENGEERNEISGERNCYRYTSTLTSILAAVTAVRWKPSGTVHVYPICWAHKSDGDDLMFITPLSQSCFTLEMRDRRDTFFIHPFVYFYTWRYCYSAV